jgi:hypothetical protein
VSRLSCARCNLLLVSGTCGFGLLYYFLTVGGIINCSSPAYPPSLAPARLQVSVDDNGLLKVTHMVTLPSGPGGPGAQAPAFNPVLGAHRFGGDGLGDSQVGRKGCTGAGVMQGGNNAWLDASSNCFDSLE